MPSTPKDLSKTNQPVVVLVVQGGYHGYEEMEHVDVDVPIVVVDPLVVATTIIVGVQMKKVIMRGQEGGTETIMVTVTTTIMMAETIVEIETVLVMVMVVAKDPVGQTRRKRRPTFQTKISNDTGRNTLASL